MFGEIKIENVISSIKSMGLDVTKLPEYIAKVKAFIPKVKGYFSKVVDFEKTIQREADEEVFYLVKFKKEDATFYTCTVAKRGEFDAITGIKHKITFNESIETILEKLPFLDNNS